jgi:hypothetical protein
MFNPRAATEENPIEMLQLKVVLMKGILRKWRGCFALLTNYQLLK